MLQTGAALDHLTCRQTEIARLIADGLSNKEIAERLVLEETTVKNYVVIIFQKLHVQTRTQIAVLLLTGQRPWEE